MTIHVYLAVNDESSSIEPIATCNWQLNFHE